ncbi:transposase [Peribacillus asahii]|uniref:transposase n=1 Tax=Peribacillus asahii TaxID=228899 RepID=UPI00207A47C2|nr:transposase [Peribacillus asahii]USK85599.1 transposase [Peribacillus asahii]
MTETEESYTSQDYPFCGGRHRTKGRTLICSVHKTEIHRDVNGAQNIARVNNITWPSNHWFLLYLNSLFGIDVFCPKNKEIPLLRTSLQQEKVSPVERRSRHRPCPLGREDLSSVAHLSFTSASSYRRW